MLRGWKEVCCVENLELWSKSQPHGQRVSDKIVWAKEILALYGDDESLYDTYKKEININE